MMAAKNGKIFIKHIPTTQFYNITYDSRVPYNIIGSVQDEGSFMGSIKNTFRYKRYNNQSMEMGTGWRRCDSCH